MASECILLKGGGGGVSSDELTATKDQVLEGSTYVGADTNDDIGVGTIPIQASKQEPSHVIHSTKGDRLAISFPIGYYGATNATNVDGLPHVYVLYSKLAEVLGIEASKMLTTETIAGVQGTIPVQGAVTPSALNCGGSYTIPAGYHDGKGKVTANSLANQTSATATSAQILKDKTAWVNGSKLTGSLAVTSAINFKATAQSATVIRISWTNPSKGPWEGVFIQMSTSGNPGVSGGTRVYTGRGNSTTAGGSNYVDITGLTPGTTYYFTCTSYASGLGNGSSHNVSAKTSGLLLYNEGNNVIGYTGNTYVTFNSNKISLAEYGYISVSNCGINLDSYSKLGVQFMCTYASRSYFGVKFIFNAKYKYLRTNATLSSANKNKVVTLYTNLDTTSFDLTGTASNHTLGISTSANSWDGTSTGSYATMQDLNTNAEIYRIWLE